jgi:uncharacterized protein (DUF2252 family)
MTLTAHEAPADRRAHGLAARDRVPPSRHGEWAPAPDRFDPVALVEAQNERRDPDLVPVRHGRMRVSPFTFYRGTAAIMAADLATTPTAGLEVQLCGDAHLSNFGVYGSPERQLVFDINDFDETLPGPFEYDVKRLAASLAVAARDNGFPPGDARSITAGAVAAYREAVHTFGGMRTLDLWYSHLSAEDLQRVVEEFTASAVERGDLKRKEAKRARKNLEKRVRKARERDSMHALGKLAEVVDGRYRIASAAPLVVPARELHTVYAGAEELAGRLDQVIHQQFDDYRSTLQPDRRVLLDRFALVDWARKVVGVGSVGTRAFIVLLEGRDEQDPLFLQVKEATTSVLAGHLPASRYAHQGERVVQGQRLMQATSDIFLGWTHGAEAGRYYYWRQLRDMKGSATVEAMSVENLANYGRLCAWTLARAHARSGDPVAIAAYLGDDDTFDRAVTTFAEAYADQTERDFAAFTEAIARGRLEAVEGV